LNIKNTPNELEKLDSGIEKVFKSILDEYGMIVIGYIGSDERVMSCLENRLNRYN